MGGVCRWLWIAIRGVFHQNALRESASGRPEPHLLRPEVTLADHLRLCCSQTYCQPSNRSQHSAPAQRSHDGGNGRVVLQNSQTRKDRVPVVFSVIGVSGGHERQNHGAGVGHVSRRIQPVLKKEEQTKDKSGSLSFVEEISRESAAGPSTGESFLPKGRASLQTSERVSVRLRVRPDWRSR